MTAVARIRWLLVMLVVVLLPVALLWCGAISVLSFFNDGPQPSHPITIGFDELARRGLNALAPGLALAAIAIVITALPGASAAGRGAPRTAGRWLALFLVGLATEHALVAAVILIRGISGWEGAIVLSAPMFVAAEVGIGIGILRGRPWARPAIVFAALPILGWAAFGAGILADVMLRTPTFAPGIVGSLPFMVGLLVGAAGFGALVAPLARKA